MTSYRGYRPQRRSTLLRLLIISAALLAVVLYLVVANPFAGKQPTVSVSREQLYQGGRHVDAVDIVSATWRAEPGNSADVEITLSFSGTDADGILVPIQSIPLLTVYRYPSPERLAINIPALSSWTALDTLSLAGQGLIDAAFCLNNTVYLQLRAPVSVSLEGVGGSLVLHLTHKPAQQTQTGYAALIDAFTRNDYSDALDMLEGIGMSPALCSDGQTILMQSQLLRGEAAANTVARKAEEICRSRGMNLKARTARVSSDTPPSVTEPMTVTERDRAWGGMNAHLVMRDARILAQAQSSPELLVERGDGALTLLNESGAHRPLKGRSLPRATKAALSADASLIAYTTATGELMIQNNDSGQTRPLGYPITPGTTTYAWLGTDTLYAMSGEPIRFYYVAADEAFFSADHSPETDTVNTADPFAGSDGVLVPTSGSLFFLESSSMAYRINLEAQTRVSVGLASEFAVSPNGAALVLMEGDASGASLTWVDTTQREQRVIGIGMPVVSFCMDAGGTRAYIIQHERGKARLYAYEPRDATLKPLAYIPSGTLYTPSQPGSVIVNCKETDGSWSVYMVTI